MPLIAPPQTSAAMIAAGLTPVEQLELFMVMEGLEEMLDTAGSPAVLYVPGLGGRGPQIVIPGHGTRGRVMQPGAEIGPWTYTTIQEAVSRIVLAGRDLAFSASMFQLYTEPLPSRTLPQILASIPELVRDTDVDLMCATGATIPGAVGGAVPMTFDLLIAANAVINASAAQPRGMEGQRPIWTMDATQRLQLQASLRVEPGLQTEMGLIQALDKSRPDLYVCPGLGDLIQITDRVRQAGGLRQAFGGHPQHILIGEADPSAEAIAALGQDVIPMGRGVVLVPITSDRANKAASWGAYRVSGAALVSNELRVYTRITTSV